MPCSDGMGPSTRVEYRTDPRLAERVIELESAICAVFSELESDGILNDVVNRAEKNGECSYVRSVWSKHKAKDIERLREDLNKYSAHELSVIKNLLK